MTRLLLLLLLPGLFLSELNPGMRQIYAYPGGIGSITYTDWSLVLNQVQVCHADAQLPCYYLYMVEGDLYDETPDTPQLHLERVGRLLVSAVNPDMVALEPELWIPQVTR